MPKPFPIYLEAEEMAVGRILRTLNTMQGILRINLNLAQDRPQPINQELVVDESEDAATAMAKWRTDGRLNSRGIPTSQNPAYRAIAEVLVKTPAHIKVLTIALQRVGILRKEAVNGYIHRMQGLALIKRTAPGTYRLTPKGEDIFFNKKERPAAARPNLLGSGLAQRGTPGLRGNHVGFRGLMLKTLSIGANLTNRDLYEILMKAGFSTKNLSTQGIKMRQEGLIDFKNGQYNITEKGRQVYNERPDASNQEEGMTAHG
jgi:predicted transcriptional regulator